MKNKAKNDGLDGHLLKNNEILEKKIAQLQIELEATKIVHKSLKEGQDFLQEVLLSEGETFVIVIDENHMINLVWCSERLEKKYGFVFQNLMGKSFKEFFNNYIKGRYSEQILEVFNNSKPLREELEAIMPSGSYWWDVTFFPIMGTNNEIWSVVVTSRDITERKKMEEKLKESEKILRNFINSATDHILLFDSELNIIEINELALKALNLERNVAIGMSLIEISPDLKKSGRYSKYMHVIKTGEPLFIEKLVVHPKYGSLSQEVKIFKVGNGLGIISRDITA